MDELMIRKTVNRYLVRENAHKVFPRQFDGSDVGPEREFANEIALVIIIDRQFVLWIQLVGSLTHNTKYVGTEQHLHDSKPSVPLNPP
jgi:hypothetical protein